MICKRSTVDPLRKSSGFELWQGAEAQTWAERRRHCGREKDTSVAREKLGRTAKQENSVEEKGGGRERYLEVEQPEKNI
jgi:hypothetical protein